MDRHLNLFYPYKAYHLEDNVTRALVVTLDRMSIAHQRIFLRRLLTPSENERSAVREQIDVDAPPDPLEFHLQQGISAKDSDGDETAALTPQTGVIVGITVEGECTIAPGGADASEADNRGRIDARITDPANEVQVILESKLSDPSLTKQIRKYHRIEFDPEQSTAEDVFLARSWNDITDSLEYVRQWSASSAEHHIIDQFIDYLDFLRLVEFRGFRADDFEKRRQRSLKRFLSGTVPAIDDERGLLSYDGDHRIEDQNISKENLWVTLQREGLDVHVVCGAGDKSRCRTFYELLKNRRDDFRKILDDLRAAVRGVDSSIELMTDIQSRFYKSYYRKQYLWSIGGRKKHPEQFDEFVDTFTNGEINTFKRLTRDAINAKFANYISEGAGPDSERRFPKWDDVDDGILQHFYFDIITRIPRERLIGEPRVQAAELFGEVLKPIRRAMEEIQELAA